MKWLLVVAVILTAASVTALGAVRIATANLNNFGWGGSDCKSPIGITQMAAALASYDIVSCQEVMRASENGQRCYGCSGYSCHLVLLASALTRVSGETWLYRLSGPYRYENRYEYYVFLYNSATVTYLGREGSASELPGSPAFEVRPPFYAYFRSGAFDFVLVDYHAPSQGSSISSYSEVQKLDAFFDSLQTLDPEEQDIILAGDLNQNQLALHQHLLCSCKASLDYLVFDSTFTGYEWTQPCHIDTGLDVRGLSDHPIVWAEFSTTRADDD